MMPDNTAPVLTENHIRRMVETSLEAVALCGASLLSDAFASVPSPSERGFLSSSPQAEPSVRISRTGVCTENLNPNVTVVKSAKNGVRFDDTAPLNWARDRRIFVQRPVRSDVVVIASIDSLDPAQMCLAQDDEMVHALAWIDPISRSAPPFCQGEASAVGLSRTSIARIRHWPRPFVPNKTIFSRAFFAAPKTAAHMPGCSAATSRD